MNRNLNNFDYPLCFSHYTERIQNLRQAKIRGEIIVAKPVLLLALIDGIEAGVFHDNRFTLNEWLEEHYLPLMRQYTRHSQFDKPTEINNPFWHLATDGSGISNSEQKLEEGRPLQKPGSGIMLCVLASTMNCGCYFKTQNGGTV